MGLGASCTFEIALSSVGFGALFLDPNSLFMLAVGIGRSEKYTKSR